MNDTFIRHLQSINIKPEIKELYLAIMKDIYSKESIDRDKEIQNIKERISVIDKDVDSAEDKLIKGELDKARFDKIT